MTPTVPEVAPNQKISEKKKCVVCENEILRDTEKCPICDSLSTGAPCKNCGKRIPTGADFCTRCSAFQNRRRYLPRVAGSFSLALAFFTVFSGVFSAATYLSDRNSHTRFKVSGADSKFLHLWVWNTGRKPSRLVRYRMKILNQDMINDVPAVDDPCSTASLPCPPALYQAVGDAVIEGGKPVKVSLTVGELLLKPITPTSPELYTKTAVKALLDKHDRPLIVIVDVDVEESGHFWSVADHPFIVRQSDIVTAEGIEEFILGRISAL